MFFKLAWRSAKKSRTENLIYFMTMIIAAAAFYIVLAIGKQDVVRFLKSIESDAVNRLLGAVIPAAYLCTLLFMFFLVVLSNKYQLEYRSRELGLCLILGMSKKRLFTQLIAEGFITSLLALCGGIFTGIFLSEVISLTTARLAGQDIIAHQSSFSAGAVFVTVFSFFFIQSVSLFILCSRLFQKEIGLLLYGETDKKQQVKTPGNSLFCLLLGILALSAAYWIVLKHFTAAEGKLLSAAAMLGIAGTLLFIRGLVNLLSRLSHRKNCFVNGLYTFTLRQLQENIVHKFISVSTSCLLITLTVILIADSLSTVISSEKLSSHRTSVYDFTISGDSGLVQDCLSSPELSPYVSGLNCMETGSMKRPENGGQNSFADFSPLREYISEKLPDGILDPALADSVSYTISKDQPAALNLLAFIDTVSSPDLISLSSYNRLLETAGEETVTLKNNEAIYYINPDFSDTLKAHNEMAYLLDSIETKAQKENKPLLFLDSQPFYLKPGVSLKGLTADENVKIFSALIVNDNLFDCLVDSQNIHIYWNFCIPTALVEQKGLMNAVMEASKLLKASGLTCESYLNNFGRQLFYIVSGSYTTLYMGFMLLIISCALLALQFLSQFQAAKKRYFVLYMVGARPGQIKKSVYLQTFLYFLIPMLLACAHSITGLSALQRFAHSSKEGQSFIMLIIVSVIVILIFGAYALACAKTAGREILKLNK